MGGAWLLGTLYSAKVLNPQNWFGPLKTLVRQRREKVATRHNVQSSVAEGLRPSRRFRMLLIATALLLCGGTVGIVWLFIQVI
jgi:hypothetical protein